MASTDPTLPMHKDERPEPPRQADGPEPSSSAGAFTPLESYLGGFWCMFVCAVLMGTAGLSLFAPMGAETAPAGWPFSAKLLLFVPIVAMELWFCTILWSGCRRKLHPVGVSVPLSLPVLPTWLRPVPALWWAGHFAVGALFQSGFLRVLTTDEAAEELGLALMLLLGFLAGFGLNWASNIFLALAVSILAPRPEVLGVFWRYRIAVDLGVALLAMLILPSGAG